MVLNAKNANVGFIGTGGIAMAMACGLCKASEFNGKIYLSVHKNRENAESVKALAPDRVFITESNQKVIDKSDVVFPTLVPEVLTAVAPTLKFRKENHIVHLASGIKLSQASWFAPACSVVRAVPLPFAVNRMGPVVYYGDDPLCCSVMAFFGNVVKVKTEKDLEVLAAVTGIMVPYYALVDEVVKWCMTKNMDFQSALDYTCYMNEALSIFMRTNCTENVAAFMRGGITPGGTNELGLNMLRKAGAYTPWNDALEQIGKRYGI